jgi:hypothetical protein
MRIALSRITGQRLTVRVWLLPSYFGVCSANRMTRVAAAPLELRSPVL